MKYRYNPSVDKAEIVKALTALLANTYLLYIQTQGSHWNVMGSSFPQLHTLFQTQYTELQLAVDVIAEHLRTYNSPALGSAKEFIKHATFKEIGFDNLNMTADDLLNALIKEHQATVLVATQLGEVAKGAIHTENLAADRIAAHEKAIWMLTATLNG